MRKLLSSSAKLITASAVLSIFICYCKIFNNLVKKVEKPWLLDKNWMIVLSISLLAYSFFRIVSSILTPRYTLKEMIGGEGGIEKKKIDNGSIFSRIVGGLIGTALFSVPGALMLNYLINPESVNATTHAVNSVKTIFIVESIGVVLSAVVLTVLLITCIIVACVLCCCGKSKDERLEQDNINRMARSRDHGSNEDLNNGNNEEYSQQRLSCNNNLRVNQSPNNQNVDDSQLPSYDQAQKSDPSELPKYFEIAKKIGKRAFNAIT